MMKRLCFAAAIAYCAWVGAASATDVTAVGVGWVREDGVSNGAASFNNTYTGTFFGTFNSWMAFEIPTGEYVAASLEIVPDFNSGQGHLIGLFDVHTPFSQFQSPSAGLSAFNDLGSGVNYTSVIFTPSLSIISLGASFMDDLNAAAGSHLLVGFKNMTTAANPGLNSVGIYTNGDGVVPVLRLIEGTAAVPEPTTWAMMIMGFAAVGVGLRRRARVAAA